MGVENWSTTAIDNATADLPDINWREGQSPGSVNNSARAMMAAIAEFRDTIAIGPASATDNAIARYNLTTGKLLQNSGVTISDSNLLTINPSWTPFDTGLWTGAVGQRIGADLEAIGASFPGDNEFNLVVASKTTGPTNSTDRTYKVGILSVAATLDPSDFDEEIYRMSVGADTRGYALDGNLTAFIFGAFSGAFFHPGSDGCARAHESEVNNFGTAESDIISPYSKFAYHAVAGGDTAVTAGLVFSSGEFIVNQFYYGIHGFPADFLTSFIELDGVHAIKPTGRGGFGTDDPDRMVHANVSDAVTDAVSGAMRLTHETSGTAAAGLGVGLEYELENASGNNKIAGTLDVKWDVATDAAEYASLQFNLMNNGTLGGAMTLSALGILDVQGYYSVDGVKVLGNQGAAVADVTGGAFVDAEARTAINALLARMRAHGAIAT